MAVRSCLCTVDEMIDELRHRMLTEVEQRKIATVVSPAIIRGLAASMIRRRRAAKRTADNPDDIDSCGRPINRQWLSYDLDEPCPQCIRGTLRTLFRRSRCRYCGLTRDDAKKILDNAKNSGQTAAESV